MGQVALQALLAVSYLHLPSMPQGDIERKLLLDIVC